MNVMNQLNEAYHKGTSQGLVEFYEQQTGKKVNDGDKEYIKWLEDRVGFLTDFFVHKWCESDESERLNKNRLKYQNSPTVASSIDRMIASVVVADDVMIGYKSEFIHSVIKEFLITGRAIFTYPPSSSDYLYNPILLVIERHPDHLRRFVIKFDKKDISNKVLFMARHTSPLDWLGTSIIDFKNNCTYPFCSEDFNTAYRKAVQNQKVE